MRSSTYAISMAPQAWPAFDRAQCVTPATVRGRSQSPSTMAASLPPISTLAGMPRSAQRTATLRPVWGDPVNTQASIPASMSAAPARPSPSSTCASPSGSSAARLYTSHALLRGVYSDGFTTMALPVSRAGKVGR
jgi:hypothetical protein